MLKVADPEWAGLRFNRRLNESSFRPAWRFDLPDALLELLASLHEGEQKEVHRRPRVVFAVVPALRTLFEHFVVTLFVLFNEAFEAHVRSEEHTSELQSRQYLVC